METFNPNDKYFGRKSAVTHTEKLLADLLTCVLTDAFTDIDVAARDAGISDASFERLRRAMDRLACAQAVLEAMGMGSMDVSDGDFALRVQMREAVELLARGWPEPTEGTLERVMVRGEKRRKQPRRGSVEEGETRGWSPSTPARRVHSVTFFSEFPIESGRFSGKGLEAFT
ncbi:hypothetical protein PQR75_43500 [Paraburkholderia fungorum]|uniref:hypothetical protein n=1 Tax=Paraburkholderia fungorum TaxID=134537 RepID=UPI0038BDD161